MSNPHLKLVRRTQKYQKQLDDLFTLRDLIKVMGLEDKINHKQKQSIGREIATRHRTKEKRQNGDSYPLSLYKKNMVSDMGNIQYSAAIYEFIEIIDEILYYGCL